MKKIPRFSVERPKVSQRFVRGIVWQQLLACCSKGGGKRGKSIGACRTTFCVERVDSRPRSEIQVGKSGKEASRVEKKGNRRGCPEAWHGRRMMARRGFGGRAERGGRMQGAINSEIAFALGSYSTPIEARYRGEVVEARYDCRFATQVLHLRFSATLRHTRWILSRREKPLRPSVYRTCAHQLDRLYRRFETGRKDRFFVNLLCLF